MEQKNKPAYPVHSEVPFSSARVGITKMELFTLEAMKGLISASNVYEDGLTEEGINILTDLAIKIAIAQLRKIDTFNNV